MKATTLAKLEGSIRPFVTSFFSPKFVISRYSKGRIKFLEKLEKDVPGETYSPSEDLSKNLWGIMFNSPLMNAAGMFKNGECYEIVARQGAGAYLGGTGTWNPRPGNFKDDIYLPFVPYPKSHTSSNWLGLPNQGDKTNSIRAERISKEIFPGCPIGWSLMGSPDFEGEEKLFHLLNGMTLYDSAGIDFIEINESCPNTNEKRSGDDTLETRLKYIKQNFLDRRTRNLPVIVKFSNDTETNQLSYLMDLLFDLEFDGVNFGNTSTQYDLVSSAIHPKERNLYDYFTKTFEGGIGGRPLRETSLALAAGAVEYLEKGKPSQEFHVIRTGGIETLEDIQESERAGISLNQWFTGYFEKFSRYGHDLYNELFNPS